jgi:hypothetical protein
VNILNRYFGNSEQSIGQTNEDPINPGKIICKFTWKYDDPLRADIGNSAKSINANVLSGHAADVVEGGLEPVAAGKDIKLVINPSPELNAAGIDISVKYRADEIPGGSFYSRGTSFIFGIRKGALAITYTLKSDDGRERTFSEITNYEIRIINYEV